MSKPLSGKRAFEAMGRSDKDRRVPYGLRRWAMQAWPRWAQQAYCRGRVMQSRNLAKAALHASRG